MNKKPDNTFMKVSTDHTQTFQNNNLCSNCDEPLKGVYCHACGQSTKSMIKFFGVLIQEVLDDVIGYDSRIKHTLFPIFFKPGKITIDYIKGKRFYYVLPLRLYLITSLLFILFLQMNSEHEDITEVSENVEKISIAKNNISSESGLKNNKNLKNNNELLEKVSIAEKQSSILIQPLNTTKKEQSDKEFDIEISESNINFKGSVFQKDGFLKDFANVVSQKWIMLQENPKPIVKQIIELFPYMLLVLIPIFAIFLKIFYLFSKCYYIEHFIFLLHNHCFIFSALMLQAFLDLLNEFLQDSTNILSLIVYELIDWVSILLLGWMVIYIMIAMRQVYKQSWFITGLKAGSLFAIYLLLISIGFMGTLLIGLYLV